MQRLFLSLLILNALAGANPIPNPNCAKPTEYVMHFLQKSGTIWKGSQNWKDQLDVLKEGDSTNTVHARTHLKEYYGLAARFLRLNETGAKSSHSIKKHNDHFEVITDIEDHEVKKAATDAELLNAKVFTKKYPHGVKHAEQDNCSKCDYHLQVQFDEQKHHLHAILTAHCTTKMPKAHFLVEVEQEA